MTTITSEFRKLTVVHEANTWVFKDARCTFSFIEGNTMINLKLSDDHKNTTISALLSELSINGTTPEDSTEAATLMEAAIEEADSIVTQDEVDDNSGGPAPGGSLGYLVAEKTLNNDEILGLRTDPIDIVPAVDVSYNPGGFSGVVNCPLAIKDILTSGSGNYTGGNAANTMKVVVHYILADVS